MHNNPHRKHIQDNILLATSKVDLACRHEGYACGCMQRLVIYIYRYIDMDTIIFSNVFQITSLPVSTRNHLLRNQSMDQVSIMFQEIDPQKSLNDIHLYT